MTQTLINYSDLLPYLAQVYAVYGTRNRIAILNYMNFELSLELTNWCKRLQLHASNAQSLQGSTGTGKQA